MSVIQNRAIESKPVYMAVENPNLIKHKFLLYFLLDVVV